MDHTLQANFLLLDGVLWPNAIARLQQGGEPLHIEPLYSGTRWKALQDVGPILVSLQSSSNPAGEAYQKLAQLADASLLYSPASIETVADHLRRFIAPPDALGATSLLRFADPLVAGHWLSSYRGMHLDAVLGPIEAWHVPNHSHTWAPGEPSPWQRFSRAGAALQWAEDNAKLGQAQLKALEQAARWQFIEQLYRDLQHNLPEHLVRIDNTVLTQWFHDRLDEGQAWGLVSERSFVIWIEYSLRWGDGFVLSPSGPYQRWLACTPDALTQAPELRIQRMDAECSRIVMTEEA